MDAVCFVLGVNAKELRGAQLRVSSIDSVVWRNVLFSDVLAHQDLIYGANSGHASSDRASVTAVFQSDEREIKFTRNIIKSSSEYRIDGKVSEWFGKLVVCIVQKFSSQFQYILPKVCCHLLLISHNFTCRR